MTIFHHSILKWIEDARVANQPLTATSSGVVAKQRLPTAEIFMFFYNTALSELAHEAPLAAYRARIVAAQYKLVNDIIKSISNSNTFNLTNIDIVRTIATNSLVVNVDANKVVRILVPLLVGLLRSFGRLVSTISLSLSSLFLCLTDQRN